MEMTTTRYQIVEITEGNTRRPPGFPGSTESLARSQEAVDLLRLQCPQKQFFIEQEDIVTTYTRLDY